MAAKKYAFSVKDSLILSDPSISLACKTWTLLDCVVIHKMENLIALHNNNEQMWLKETENYVCEITDPKHPFFYNKEWYLSEMETERERVREFACLLEYHADSVVDSEFFSIGNYDNMGLGLSAKVDITVDQLAEEIPGYLEIISEPLFQTLQILGHKSLYKYKDTDNRSVTLFAILYGPLSLVNSKQGVKIGFMQCNPVSHKDLYYEYKLQVTATATAFVTATSHCILSLLLLLSLLMLSSLLGPQRSTTSISFLIGGNSTTLLLSELSSLLEQVVLFGIDISGLERCFIFLLVLLFPLQ